MARYRRAKAQMKKRVRSLYHFIAVPPLCFHYIILPYVCQSKICELHRFLNIQIFASAKIYLNIPQQRNISYRKVYRIVRYIASAKRIYHATSAEVAIPKRLCSLRTARDISALPIRYTCGTICFTRYVPQAERFFNLVKKSSTFEMYSHSPSSAAVCNKACRFQAATARL